jgi:hypothetical protein
MPPGGATKDENYSPPPEGCRGGLWRTEGPTPKADAGDSQRSAWNELFRSRRPEARGLGLTEIGQGEGI